jgi:phosphoglycolate phosphatase
MTYTTVIFDMDGTLLNTLDDLKDSLNYALNQMGFPTRTLDEVRQFVGNGARLLIERAVPAGTAKEPLDTCLEIYAKHYATNNQNKTKPYDGIIDLLKELKDKEYKLAIVSNKFDSSVKALCKEHYDEYIKVAIGESQHVARKPAPDSVFTAMKELGSKVEETIYIGDSDVDVHTAHNAGLKCVGVTWGFRDREILHNAGADYIIDKPMELLKILADA